MRLLLDFMLGVMLRAALLYLFWRAPRPVVAGSRRGAIENDAEAAFYTLISKR